MVELPPLIEPLTVKVEEVDHVCAAPRLILAAMLASWLAATVIPPEPMVSVLPSP